MDIKLEIGLKSSKRLIVTTQHTAKTYGSGLLDVFATPAMIALMEATAMEAVQPFLPPGYGTVGVSLDVKHVAATPLKMEVTSNAELVEVNGKRLKFRVTAFDEKDLIGEGHHERYIINEEKFFERIQNK